MTALVVFLVAGAALAEPLTPAWSKPHGLYGRLVGLEEFGRCLAFADSSQIRIVTPQGDVAWTWAYKKASRYLVARQVAVSHACDAIALVGDASYKYAWIVTRDLKSVHIPFTTTPAEAAFDRTGQLVAIGTYAGTLQLHERSGAMRWKRDTEGVLIQALHFTDDNSRIVFKGWGGAGVVILDGQVEWSQVANRLAVSRDLRTLVFGHEPNHGPGLPQIQVTDASRHLLWQRWASVEAFVSGTGHRVLATIDREQEKSDDDFYAGRQMTDVQLLSRAGELVAAYPAYDWPIALSDDGTKVWLRAAGHIACVSDDGSVLAEIAVVEAYRNDVFVSRDFSQVVVARQVNGKPASVDRYEVPAACRPEP